MSKDKKEKNTNIKGGGEQSSKQKPKKNSQGNSAFWGIVVLAIVAIAGLYFMNNKNIHLPIKNNSGSSAEMKKVSDKEGADIKKMIEDNKDVFFGQEAKVSINKIEKGDGIIKVGLTVNGDEAPFYLTDSKKLILQVVPIEKITKGKNKVLEGVEIKKGQVVINDKLKEAVKNFINNYLIQGGGKDAKVEIGKISKEDGLIKVSITLQGQEQPIYLTPNGSKVAFRVISLDGYKKEVVAQQAAQKKAAEVSEENKNDRPQVDIFVMSYCPYGTQFEKGIIPVLRLLKDKIDARIRFVDYAMHNKKELDENVVQYCIQKNTPDKFYDYLECFLEEGKSKECVQKTGIDAKGLADCSDATDKQFKVSENFKDKSTWKGQFPTFDIDKADNAKYGVQGSPTLIINGQKIQPAGRDSKHLLEAVCSGFKNPPAECQKDLSSKSPSVGFGSGTTSGGSGGGCGQ